MRPTGFGYGGYTAGDPEKMMKEAEQLKDIRFKPSPGILKVIPGMEVMRENATFRPVTPLPLSPDNVPSYERMPVNGTAEERMAVARKNAALPKVTPEQVWDSVSGYEHPYMPNWMLQDKPPRSIEALVTPMMKLEDKQFRGTSANSYFPQPEKIEATGASPNRPAANAGAAGAVPSQPNQAAANASAAGNNMSRQSITIAGREWPLVGKPGTFERVPVKGGGMAFIGYTGGDDTRNFQYAIRHEPVRRRSAQQAQPQQPRGLHYVPGGWANDGYSFEGSAEDRARFFAPVPRPYNHAPRSDNDTFLALQRQKAMQPVEQPLPERPEFPADPKMGWHTKLAKYQADMDAYNRQMASRAGYQQAMDVEALRQMQRESPAEAARLERQLGLQERQLGLQERQAAQQAAYQQAQLDQQNMKTALDYQAGIPGRQVQEAQLGYQMAMAKARQDVIDAMNSGDQERIKKAESVWKLFSDNENKQDKKEKWSVQKITDGNGEDRYFRVEENSGATYPIDFNVPTQIDQNVVRDNSAFLDKMIRDYPDMASDLNRLRSSVGNPNFRNEIKAMIERANR